jgi:hypothetical protein
MKKTIKWLLIIGVFILLLKLYWHPKWNSELPESISVSKKAGAFLWEYEINIDSIYCSAYKNTTIFKEVFATKSCNVKRNKLGMIHLEASPSQEKYFVMRLQNKDTLLNMDNYILRRWTILDNYGEGVGKHWDILCLGINEGEFECTYTDTLYYTVYRNKIPDSHATENLIPLFKMTLIPK